MRKSAPLTLEDAEALALNALAYLAGEPARLQRFLTLTGLDPSGLRAAAGDAATLSAVLEHVMGDESLLLELTANLGIDPARVAPALMLLSGPRRS